MTAPHLHVLRPDLAEPRCTCNAPWLDGRCAWLEVHRQALNLTDRVTLSEVPSLLRPWAELYARPAPTHKLVQNWAWRRPDFPEPVSARQDVRADGTLGKPAREYDVLEVLVWWVGYSPARGGRPRRDATPSSAAPGHRAKEPSKQVM